MNKEQIEDLIINYLSGDNTQEEKDLLLDEMLRYYNGTLILLRRYKDGKMEGRKDG